MNLKIVKYFAPGDFESLGRTIYLEVNNLAKFNHYC
jgi:hypothetical protein